MVGQRYHRPMDFPWKCNGKPSIQITTETKETLDIVHDLISLLFFLFLVLLDSEKKNNNNDGSSPKVFINVSIFF